MRRPGLITALAFVMATLAACGGEGASPSGGGSSLDGTSWQLSTIAGTDALPGGSLRFDGGKLSGSTGCNTFGGTYHQSGTDLAVTLGPITMMGCPPPLGDQEQAVLDALGKTTSFSTSGGTLTLLDKDGAELLSYAHHEPASLAGPPWQVTGMSSGKDTVTSTIQGTDLTATFGADGALTGNAGCNTYSATYTLEGPSITITPPAATRMFCSSPQGVMDQEAAFLAALEKAATVEPTAGGFTLRSADGATQVMLAPAG